MAAAVLDEQRAALFARERAVIDALRVAVDGLEAAPVDIEALVRAAHDLESIFLLVVVGEFNAGKSALINALAGEAVMPVGATPTTAAVTRLRYGATEGETRRNDVVERQAPAEFLRHLAIVDTPGTNAVIRRHEEITRDFVPRADLVLFVTSSDRPFTESERSFLELIRDWGKKVVIVVNKVDLLSEADLADVLAFVERHATALLGSRPEMFPLAARPAFEAKQAADPDERVRLLAASRFVPFERYIVETLDETSRLRLKLLSPLGVAEQIGRRYLTLADERLALLRDDLRAIDSIERQLAAHVEDMRREARIRLTEIDQIVWDLQQRGDRFFDATFRLANIIELIKSERIRATFEREVIADTAARLDERVQALIDWMVDQELRLWQAVMEALNRRRLAQPRAGMLGDTGRAFDINRRQLLQSVARAARDVVDDYDRVAEASKLADDMRAAVAQTALAGAGALSLGTAIAVLVGTTAADVTGVLAALTIGGLGLFIIPARKRMAQRQFHDRLAALRQRLSESLSRQFEAELTRAQANLRDAVAPYTRFVRAEHEQVSHLRGALTTQQAAMAALRDEIERLNPVGPAAAGGDSRGHL
ncbi:MAG: dynamin family protein [Chloroflexi bacterium]|nr:dynamin family protein [Chloroflexota bacterium]